ncbi:hypothetical protein [Turneriella parva]|uniref:Uncharacterized protein n=1 Tax=Turneriella parva (strain ATCC BAA-1111 / DSM 21527 / NCTC 11395 / H) TaxID=869212 RepID=I4BBW8_TURPD|nr:hypothetical protein [Turneriella parva]AFM14775.1 hypothetical protein Turpa_4142 [Turneriella parva DSM 21527]
MVRSAAFAGIIFGLSAALSITTANGTDETALPALGIDPHLNPLPAEVLAFPSFTENYRTRILSGDYEIWSEEKLQRWSSAQGLSVTTDDQGAGLQYHRAAIISPPGITFTLKRPVTEKGSEFANGWVLNLDFAAIRARNGESLQKARSLYSNLLQCDVIVDGELYTTVRQGAKKSIQTPLRLPIPHIRSNEGIVRVELRLANHPRNFLFLYDAYLTR